MEEVASALRPSKKACENPARSSGTEIGRVEVMVIVSLVRQGNGALDATS